MTHGDDTSRLLVSHLTLRRTIGVLGIGLPVVLAIGCVVFGACTGLLDSISAYYATEVRDVFVGILFAVAWFLFAYRGYDRRDDLAGDLACVFALGVALFPFNSPTGWVAVAHFLSAALLFSVLAYFALALFTKSKPGSTPTSEKLKRNRVYRACGWTMIGCVVAIAIYSWLLRGTGLSALNPVFWLESLALWAFGLSWFVKGETLWTDAQPHP